MALPDQDPKPEAQTQEDWEAILAAEGMPGELESTQEAHSDAFEKAVSGLYFHYAITETANYGAHKDELMRLRDQAKAGGASQDEIELLDEDFARDIEDAVTNINRMAVDFAGDVVRTRPMLVERPKAVANLVFEKLRAELDESIGNNVLKAVADKAAHKVS